jgi:hypothetical protein
MHKALGSILRTNTQNAVFVFYNSPVLAILVPNFFIYKPTTCLKWRAFSTNTCCNCFYGELLQCTLTVFVKMTFVLSDWFLRMENFHPLLKRRLQCSGGFLLSCHLFWLLNDTKNKHTCIPLRGEVFCLFALWDVVVPLKDIHMLSLDPGTMLF